MKINIAAIALLAATTAAVPINTTTSHRALPCPVPTSTTTTAVPIDTTTSHWALPWPVSTSTTTVLVPIGTKTYHWAVPVLTTTTPAAEVEICMMPNNCGVKDDAETTPATSEPAATSAAFEACVMPGGCSDKLYSKVVSKGPSPQATPPPINSLSTISVRPEPTSA